MRRICARFPPSSDVSNMRLITFLITFAFGKKEKALKQRFYAVSKHLNVWYCGKGVSCNGEHFIFEDVKVHHDYIGFVFGDRHTVGKQEHPNIMIGCSIEGCYRLMTLSKNGITTLQDYDTSLPKSTLIMIGTSTEASWSIPTNEVVDGTTKTKTLPIKEIVKNGWRGRIEID